VCTWKKGEFFKELAQRILRAGTYKFAEWAGWRSRDEPVL
jgi:hypothetical protein